MSEKIDIPIDIYDSDQEIVILIPLGGVNKDSIEVFLEKTSLVIRGERTIPNLKEIMSPIQQECFRGSFGKTIQLPQNIYFDKIQSTLTKENILLIIVPKIMIPEKIKLDVQAL